MGCQTRWPEAASISARASRTATASASSARASAGVVASRAMHEAQGPSSMPRLRSTAQITTSAQAVRLPIRTFSPPDLPDPVAPPNRPCRRRNSTLAGVASSNGPRSIGWVIDVDGRAGPGDRVGVRVGVQHPQLEPVRQVIRGRVDADGAAEDARARTRWRAAWRSRRRWSGREPGRTGPASPTCRPRRT